MRIYVRVIPGLLSLSATKRGVRVHAGPRVARLHAGAGKRGVSTGAGPVSLYKPIGKRKPR